MSEIQSKYPLLMTEIEKGFGTNRVLDGATLELAAGSITGLLGRNGAGKTTLLRTSVGLLKSDRGAIKIFGEDAWNCPAHVRQRLGYVPQDFNDLGWLDAEDALALVGSFYNRWDFRLVEKLMNEWDVPRTQRLAQLSHGQRQKVGILLAIGHRPDLLILDEPVASLDPAARHDFLRTLLMLNDELNQTILFSSHITTDIERVAADVAILHSGKVIYHGAVDELKEQVQCLYLRADEVDGDNRLFDGFISSRVDGNKLQVWVRDWSDEKRQALGDQLGTPVHSENVGLEELFMGMTA